MRKTPAAVTRLAEAWPWSFQGWLAFVRHTGQRALQDSLPPETTDEDLERRDFFSEMKKREF